MERRDNPQFSQTKTITPETEVTGRGLSVEHFQVDKNVSVASVHNNFVTAMDFIIRKNMRWIFILFLDCDKGCP